MLQDPALHKVWVLLVNEVFTQKVRKIRDQSVKRMTLLIQSLRLNLELAHASLRGAEQVLHDGTAEGLASIDCVRHKYRSTVESLWLESAVENLILAERIVEALTRQGYKPEIKFRLTSERSNYIYRLELPCILYLFTSVPDKRGLQGIFNSDLGAESQDYNSTVQLDCENNERVKAYYKDELLVSKGNVKY